MLLTLPRILLERGLPAKNGNAANLNNRGDCFAGKSECRPHAPTYSASLYRNFAHDAL